MKQFTNKAIYTLLAVTIFIFSCKTDQKSTAANVKAKDTITTASGFKVFLYH